MFKNNKIILLVLLIILAFVGYRYFFKKDGSSDASLVAQSVEGGGAAIGSDLLVSLSKLKSLTLDTSFFSDPIFNNLSDFSVPIINQEVGRDNPFSPLGGSVSSDSTPSSGKKTKN